MLSFEPITIHQEPSFRKMVMDYWHFVVPGSFFLNDPIQAEAEFQSRYRWSGGSNHPYWMLLDDKRIGFFMMRHFEDGTACYMHDFFVVEKARGYGYGSEMFQLLRDHLKRRGVYQIQLSVQADNPAALAFWEKQGFQVIYHRLAQSI